MKPLGLPQACEATAVLIGNCARQLHVFSQCLVRQDLADEVPPQSTTLLNACKVARESIAEIECMLTGAVAPPPDAKPIWVLGRGAVKEFRALRVRPISDFEARAALHGLSHTVRGSEQLPGGCRRYRAGQLLLIVEPPSNGQGKP